MSRPLSSPRARESPQGGSFLRSWFLHGLAWITRRLRFPGRERLVRWVCDPDGPRNVHIQRLVRYQGDFLLQVDTSSFLEWYAFFFGCHDPEVISQIREHLPKDGAALDVGANIGLMTLVMAQAAGSGGRVIAVEPVPSLFERLSQNLRMNGLEGVALYKCALGEKAGRAILHCPAPDAANQGCATFASKTQTPLPDGLEVDVQTIDQIIRREGLSRLDFIKIDTEGWDLFVLRGGRSSIESFRPVLLFEYMKPGWSEAQLSLAEAEQWLHSLHYRLFALRGKRLTPLKSERSACFNILALPEPP